MRIGAFVVLAELPTGAAPAAIPLFSALSVAKLVVCTSIFYPALAWRYNPGGEGEEVHHPPPVDPRRSRDLFDQPYPSAAAKKKRPRDDLRHDRRRTSTSWSSIRGAGNESRGRRRHFHQLSRQLRLQERGALQDRVLNNLGNFDDLLDVRQRLVEDLQYFHH